MPFDCSDQAMKTSPFEMEGELQPILILAFQATEGPSSGHSRSVIFSGEVPSPRGPWNWAQSSAAAMDPMRTRRAPVVALIVPLCPKPPLFRHFKAYQLVRRPNVQLAARDHRHHHVDQVHGRDPAVVDLDLAALPVAFG